MALCGNPAPSDTLAVAPRALRACACGAVHIFVAFAWLRGSGVFEACRRCVVGVLRRCAVGLCFGRVLHTHGSKWLQLDLRLFLCWLQNKLKQHRNVRDQRTQVLLSRAPHGPAATGHQECQPLQTKLMQTLPATLRTRSLEGSHQP